MKDTLDSKIQELAREASDLSNVKSGLIQQLKEIDVRLTQIAGAIVEIKKIQTELKGDNDGEAEDRPNNQQ